MPCLLCASDKVTEFTAEMNIHLSGLANIDNPGVLVFTKLLVCLECGSSRFLTPNAELSQLAGDTVKCDNVLRQRDHAIVHRRKITLGA